MTTAPPAVDPIASFLASVVSALVSGGETAAEAYVTTTFPALANPLLEDILDWVVSELGTAVQDAIINATTQAVIVVQTNAEQQSLINTATAYQVALETGNASAIQAAKTAFIASWGSLLHWDGTFNTSVPNGANS